MEGKPPNYIKIINTYWDIVPYLDGYKPAYASLFFSILDSINKNQWNDCAIEYDRIISKSALGKRTYLEARRWLKENNIITLVEGKGDYQRAKFGIRHAVLFRTSCDTTLSIIDMPTPTPHSAPIIYKQEINKIIDNDSSSIRDLFMETDFKESIVMFDRVKEFLRDRYPIKKEYEENLILYINDITSLRADFIRVGTDLYPFDTDLFLQNLKLKIGMHFDLYYNKLKTFKDYSKEEDPEFSLKGDLYKTVDGLLPEYKLKGFNEPQHILNTIINRIKKNINSETSKSVKLKSYNS